MRSLRLRRAVAVAVFAAALLPLTDLHAAPRAGAPWERPDRAERVIRDRVVSLWNVLVGIWENAGLRIDDNG